MEIKTNNKGWSVLRLSTEIIKVMIKAIKSLMWLVFAEDQAVESQPSQKCLETDYLNQLSSI